MSNNLNRPTLYDQYGQQLYASPRESPQNYRPRPTLNREIKRSISQYDHAELISLSTVLCARVPALRAAIRDKNSWAFAHWLPVYMGEDEKWGEEAEEWLTHEVLPTAVFRELRQDYAWGMRVSGMGLDMQGSDLAIFTEDENHLPKIAFIPAPRLGSGIAGAGAMATIYSGSFASGRADGQSIVQGGRYQGLPIYNGIIRKDGKPIAARVLGYDEQGNPNYTDIKIGFAFGTHYANEMEFFGQGAGLPRPISGLLQWMNKEEIDRMFQLGLKNASERTVIHKLPPGQDVAMARGNAVIETKQQVPIIGDDGEPTTEERTVFVERSPDGSVTYIGADEELAGLVYENPHPNAEDFARRILMECLADVGWCLELLDTSSSSRAPTRLGVSKANNSIWERQSTEEPRTIQFFQHAIAMGMAHGKISRNTNGLDPFKWAVGFPAAMSIDAGNDVKASLDQLRMGLTSRRIEAAKAGFIQKHILRDQKKEVNALLKAASDAWKFAQGLPGGENFTFDQSMSMFWQPSPNAPQPPQQANEPDDDDSGASKAAPAKRSKS